MLNLRVQRATGAEEFFVANYERLLGWALHLTAGDRSIAEDLLHDVFVLLRVQQLDVRTIQNLDGYLYAMLRNLHISRLRRAARTPLRQFSVIEFDSAETGLRSVGALDHVQVQDQLRTLCRFACQRKEKAKAMCALILRFFHGYYPSEVARVLTTTRQAVDVRLLSARNEARLVLQNPKALAFVESPKMVATISAKSTGETYDLLTELQQMIFASCRGECLSGRTLSRIYEDGGESQLAQPQLAHIVSCVACLDEINRLLDIPPLSERHPADSVKRKPRDGGGGDGPGGGLSASELRKLQRRAGQILEHRPRQLCVSVNGNPRGSQYVTSEHSELSLVVDESIDFIEVFSEQDVRLLMLPFAESRTENADRSLRVTLSDNRTLELSLKCDQSCSTLRVLYEDPTFSEVASPAQATEYAEGSAPTVLQLVEEAAWPTPLQRFANNLKSWLSTFTAIPFWTRPSTVTAMVALLLVTAVLIWRLPVPTTVSAAELLSRSAAAERQTANAAGLVLHRTINLEESAGTVVLSRRRIEVWQSGDRGVTARRLFNEQGQLLGGEWRTADGSHTVYWTPTSRTPTLPAVPTSQWSVDDVWRWDLSASDFTSLIRGAERALVEERGENYVVTYDAANDSHSNGLVTATLVLESQSLQAVEQKLVVGEGANQRQFEFRQSGYDRKLKDSVPEATFEPDSEFLKVGVIRIERSQLDISSAAKSDAATLPEETSDRLHGATASLALEVEVLRLLNQVGADLGEQITVSRTSKGAVHVRALVETNERKIEILRTLKPVATAPAIVLDVLTAAEAQRLQLEHKTSRDITVQQVEPSDDRLPADAELRRYLSKNGTKEGEELESEIRRFAVRASGHSRLLLQHAWALQRLLGRFSSGDFDSSNREAQIKWLAMIRTHAGTIRREATALRQQLQPVFAAGSGGSEALRSLPDGELNAKAQPLLEACTVVDSIVRSAFSLSTETSASQIDSLHFWIALGRVDGLAEQIISTAQKLSNTVEVRQNLNPRKDLPSDAPVRPLKKREGDQNEI